MTQIKNYADYPVITPIPDSNGNGVLDGEDILAQLKKEGRFDRRRTADERGHGVIDSLGFRAVVQTIYTAVSNNQYRYESNELEQATEILNEQLRDVIDSMQPLLAKTPDIRTQVDAETTLQALRKKLSQEHASIARADAQHMLDFIQTFKTTFPHGINIESKHIVDIMSYFGPVVVPQHTVSDLKDAAPSR